MTPITSARIERLLLRLIGVCLVAATLSAQPQPTDDESPIELPPVFVEPAGRPERWTLLQAPGFELLTTHDATFARAYARNYFRQLELVRRIVPDRYLWNPYLPTRHIVVAASNKRRESDAAMRDILDRLKRERATARDNNSNAPRERFLPNMRLSGHDGSVVFAFQDDTSESAPPGGISAYRTLRSQSDWGHEPTDFHFSASRLDQLLRQRSPALPEWAIQGLVRVYERCAFTRDSFALTDANWFDPTQSEALRLDRDHPRALLAWDDFFASPPPTDSERLRLWQEQAGLFARWALYSDDGYHRDAFWTFLDKLEHSTPDEALFRSVFGLGFADARDRMSDYLPQAIVETIPEKLGRHYDVPEFAVSRATAVQVAEIRGEWERLETGYIRRRYPALTENYLTRARATLARVDATEATPDLRALRGLLEFEAGERDVARQELEAAVALGIRRPYVLQVLAQIRFDALRAESADPKRVDPDRIGAVRVLLDTALESSIALPEAYGLLAEMWRASQAPIGRPEIIPLAAGVRRYPHLPQVVVQMVLLQAERGEVRSALQILHYARERCRDAQTAVLYDKLAAHLLAAR